MKPLPPWFTALTRAIGTLSPSLMAAIAYRMFWSLGRTAPVKANVRDIHDRADVRRLTVGDRSAVVYRWGEGPETVLLVHGWRGRASQFGNLVRALESPRRTVIAFDAPGNGESPGHRTDIVDYIAIINAIADERDGIDTIVGHSLGVLAVFVAVREGASVLRMVSVAGVSSFDYAVREFADALGLNVRTTRIMRRMIERGIFTQIGGSWSRFTAELDPTDETTPLLAIHDASDRAVNIDQLARITEAHLGPTTVLRTERLGHSRVLSDDTVVEAIVRFAD